jgi:hypothetical protein
MQINGALLTRDVVSQSHKPGIKELLRNIQSEMVTSRRRPSRHAFDEMGFLGSDYFKDRIKVVLSKDVLGRTLKGIKGLLPSVVKDLL